MFHGHKVIYGGSDNHFIDIVTSTSQQSLRGPRAGMIFFKEEVVLGVCLESAINGVVRSSFEVGPHNMPTTAALAVCLKHATSVDFKNYKNQGITGAEVEQILNMACVIVNKISVPGQRDPLIPLDICIGSAAMTTRGLREKEFELIADLIHEGVQISLEVRNMVLQTREHLNLVLSSNFYVRKWKYLPLCIPFLKYNPYTGLIRANEYNTV